MVHCGSLCVGHLQATEIPKVIMTLGGPHRPCFLFLPSFTGLHMGKIVPDMKPIHVVISTSSIGFTTGDVGLAEDEMGCCLQRFILGLHIPTCSCNRGKKKVSCCASPAGNGFVLSGLFCGAIVAGSEVRTTLSLVLGGSDVIFR